MTTVTQWFEMDIQPHHVGVYEVNNRAWLHSCVVYSKWDGHEWKICSPDIDEADNTTERSDDCYQDFVLGWRGLTSPDGE